MASYQRGFQFVLFIASLSGANFLCTEKLQAAIFNIDGESVPLNPVSGSDWSREPGNENKIPYEQCWVVEIQRNSNSKDVFDVSNLSSLGRSFLFYSETEFKPDQDPVSFYKMLCFSKYLKLASIIPVTLGKIKHSGLNLEPFVHANLIEKIRVHDLNGKLLKDFFGRFSGSDFSFGAGIGGGVQSLTNRDKFRLTNSAQTAKIGVSAGYASIDISPGLLVSAQSYSTTREFLPNPDVTWTEVQVPSRSEVRTELALQLDFQMMENYEFVQISP